MILGSEEQGRRHQLLYLDDLAGLNSIWPVSHLDFFLKFFQQNSHTPVATHRG
jgi:hypothetical protein